MKGEVREEEEKKRRWRRRGGGGGSGEGGGEEEKDVGRAISEWNDLPKIINGGNGKREKRER